MAAAKDAAEWLEIAYQPLPAVGRAAEDPPAEHARRDLRDLPTLTIDPVTRLYYEHLEYKPLVNSRVHALGQRRQIVNDAFHAQYHRFLKTLTYHGNLDDTDLLAVVFDVHPSDEFKLKLRTDDRHVEAFAEFWRALARHLSARDPERLFLEIINEPMAEDAYRWMGIQARVAAAAERAVDDHVAAARVEQVDGLGGEDRNVGGHVKQSGQVAP